MWSNETAKSGLFIFLKKDRNFVGAVFLLSLLIRILFIVLFRFEIRIEEGDQLGYDNFALQMLGGFNWLAVPTSIRPPGYPAFLAGIYWIFGHNYDAVRFIQVIISSVSVLLIFYLAREIFGRKIAFLSALWSAFYPFFSRYVELILRETLSVFLMLLLVISLHRVYRKSNFKNLILSVIPFTLLVHTNAKYLFYLPFIFVWMWVTCSGKRIAVMNYAVFFILLLATMVPWTVRNYVAYDRFVLINAHCWDRKIPAASGRVRLFARGIERTVKGGEDSDYHKGLMKNLKSRTETLSLAFSKVFWQFERFWRICRFKGGPDPALGGLFNKKWALIHNLARIVFLGSLLPFFLVGLVQCVRKWYLPSFVFIFPIIAHTTIHSLLHGGRPRYRLPVVGFIIIIAFYGIIYVYDLLRKFIDRRRVPG